MLGTFGKLANDRNTQHQATERYQQYRTDLTTVDADVVPALVNILAHIGDEARYEEFSERYRTAATPQEERRYLFSLAAFSHAPLLDRTLARTLNGEIRMQDAPFIVGSLLTNVYGREQAWEFVKANWDQMDKLFPKQGLRRMCGGIVGLTTPELEQDVQKFFHSRKIDLGRKVLDQYLEQLRVAVSFRERKETRFSTLSVARSMADCKAHSYGCAPSVFRDFNGKAEAQSESNCQCRASQLLISSRSVRESVPPQTRKATSERM